MNNKKIYAWAIYDWGNSAYATAVMAGFFPVFFKQYYSSGMDVSTSTAWLGIGNSVGSLFIVLLAPILGSIADAGGLKKRLLTFFALFGILMTASLALIEKGNMPLALAIYSLSALGFAGSNIFYDSLLPHTCEKHQYERVSSLGYALGYLGGGIVFLIGVLLTQFPGRFGLASASQGIKVSFLLTAGWWLIFTIPLLLIVKEPKRTSSEVGLKVIAKGYKQLIGSFKKIKKLKVAMLFLVAYWFYIDGVGTIIKMAVDFGLSIGLQSSDLIKALLMIQFIGFPATLLVAIGYKIGVKPTVLFLIFIYFIVVIWASIMKSSFEFFALAVLIGLAQGGIQALSRAIYARITPKEYSGEFFGFYNMLGKFAAIFGPLLIAGTALIWRNPRISILPLALLFIIGGCLLYRIDLKKGEEEAENYFLT